MHSSLSTAARQWKAAQQQLMADIAAIEASKQALSPMPGAWSALQVAKHLIIAEAGTLAAIQKSLARPQLTPMQWRQRFNYGLFRLYMLADVRIKAPRPELLPPPQHSLEELATEWANLHRHWDGQLQHFGPELLNKQVFKHPLIGLLDISHTLGFMTVHIHHHRKQVARIRAALKG